MELQDILEKHREYYLNHYNEVTSSIKDSQNEILLKLPAIKSNEVFELYRYDIISGEKESPNIQEINTDGYLNHEELGYSVNNKGIVLSPIVWNGVDFTVDKEYNNFKTLINWAKNWIDSEDKSSDTKPQGFIHSITEPEVENNNVTFSVDFGTAPIDSLIELLILLSKEKEVNNIKLSSTWMTGE